MALHLSAQRMAQINSNARAFTESISDRKPHFPPDVHLVNLKNVTLQEAKNKPGKWNIILEYSDPKGQYQDLMEFFQVDDPESQDDNLSEGTRIGLEKLSTRFYDSFGYNLMGAESLQAFANQFNPYKGQFLKVAVRCDTICYVSRAGKASQQVRASVRYSGKANQEMNMSAVDKVIHEMDAYNQNIWNQYNNGGGNAAPASATAGMPTQATQPVNLGQYPPPTGAPTGSAPTQPPTENLFG